MSSGSSGAREGRSPVSLPTSLLPKASLPACPPRLWLTPQPRPLHSPLTTLTPPSARAQTQSRTPPRAPASSPTRARVPPSRPTGTSRRGCTARSYPVRPARRRTLATSISARRRREVARSLYRPRLSPLSFFVSLGLILVPSWSAQTLFLFLDVLDEAQLGGASWSRPLWSPLRPASPREWTCSCTRREATGSITDKRCGTAERERKMLRCLSVSVRCA